MVQHKILSQTFRSKQLFFNFLFGILFGFVVTQTGLMFRDSRVGFNIYLKDLLSVNYYLTPVTDSTKTCNYHAECEEVQCRDADILGEDGIRKWMSTRIRILCWILTSPQSLETKATHVKNTWARRCNTVLYMSSENNEHFPTIAVADSEGREYLWQKTSNSIEYIYRHYLDKADWFLKADDDTFVIVENLRKLLSLFDPKEPIFFGRKFKRPNKPQIVYMQGGAGYVLSRKAVEVWVQKILNSSKHERFKEKSEDIMVSTLLVEEGVTEGYSREGIHETFHALAPEETIVPKPHEYTAHNFYHYEQGPECCSDYSISFHHVTPDNMYWLDYMVYHFRPFGVGYYSCPGNIHSIVGLPEVSPAGEGNATDVDTKEEISIKKSTEKPAEVTKEPQKKKEEGQSQIRIRKRPLESRGRINTKRLPKKKYERKHNSKKKGVPKEGRRELN